MKAKSQSKKLLVKETESESMETRVALHPFLAGMDRTQLALLIDCAMATHFKPDEINRRGRLTRLVTDVPALCLAFHTCAIEPTETIFFYGTTLREYCEKNHSLGYELFKRIHPA